jgi:acetyl-CoA carboxylase biotin carboxyl carrier protein
VPLDFKELRELLATLNQTDVTELSLKGEDFELTIRRGLPATSPLHAIGSQESGVVSIVSPPPLASNQSVPQLGAVSLPTPSTSISAVPSPLNDLKLADIISPMVGTFYSAPAPDEPLFVEVNQRIRIGQTVCIIEAMKLMNEIEAEVAGEVVDILVQNGDSVEYGQVLMRVRTT